MKTRYIFSMGKISKKDKSIMFKNKKETIYIPIQNTREIYFFNEVSLNTKLLNLTSKNKIVFHFFNYYGSYIGSYYPKRFLQSGNVLIAQVRYFDKHRLKVAKAIVKAIALNIYELLYHYYRHGKKELKPLLDWLKNDVQSWLEKDININQILFIEGQIWSRFYDSFKHFLPKDFLLNKRVKRPPNNPMNALIGFGNSLLYTKTITAIYHTHLNQTVSFLHSPSDARFSLSLDLSEAFKPIIVFKTIFDLINNKRLKVERDFDKNLNYALLNQNGKKIFIKAFEDRINSKFYHSKLKRHTSYFSAIKYDGYKLIKTILEDKEFIPFSLKDKI